MTDDYKTAFSGYLEWATRDAATVTKDDYERLVERLRAAGSDDGMKEAIAGASDGELLWIMGVTDDLPPRSDKAAHAEALKFRDLALYEQVRRTIVPGANAADERLGH